MCCFALPQRFVVAILCVIGVIVGYGQRITFTIAITRIVLKTDTNQFHTCPIINGTIENEEIRGGHHNWSESTQGWLLNSFYVGYFIGQLPCGLSADIFGGRITYATGMAVATGITILTPLIIQYTHWYLVYSLRLLLGIAQGVMYPAMSALIAHWVPPFERATVGAFCFASNSLGTVIGTLSSGYTMMYSHYWPTIFYGWGAIGLIWVLLFALYVYDSPQKHPRITEKELAFLEKVMVHSVKLKVPWKGIFSDRGIWALIIGESGHGLTLFLTMTNMPKYFSDVLQLSISDISLITSIPFIGSWALSIVFGKISDYGIQKRNWSVRATRSVMTYLSFLAVNSMLCAMVYMRCNEVASAICFAVSVISKGPLYASYRINHMDLTVNFTGFTMSLINMSGCLAGFVSPLLISNVAPNNTFKEWTIVTWIYFGISFFTFTYYVMTAKFERAIWDVPLEELDEFKRVREEKAAIKAAEKAKQKEGDAAKQETTSGKT